MKKFSFYSKINSKRAITYSKNRYFIFLFFYLIVFFTLFFRKSSIVFDDLYYFFLFGYSPLSFFAMEFFFKNREIKYLNNFSLSNREIISFFIKKSILKLSFFSILGMLLFSAHIYPDFNLIKLLSIQWIFYHPLFVATTIGVYAYTTKFILDDSYDSLKKILSGGWTDPKLSPFLFAPAIIVAVVNIIHIFVAKAIEGLNNNYLIKEPLYITVILTSTALIYGIRVFPKYVRRVYAFINNYQYLYDSGSYKIESSFWEERFLIFFINLFNKKEYKKLKIENRLIPLIKKDISILKRKYRIFSLLTYLFSIILLFIFIFMKTITIKTEIFILISIFLLLIPTYFFIFLDAELKFLYPIEKKDLFISKLLVSSISLSPMLIVLLGVSTIYPTLSLIFPIFFFNFIFSYFFKERYYVLFLNLILLSTILIF
ncbi:hypothetical protein JXR93_01170 [bacterium]|nr:hypothetical protein [bacterium]